MAEAEVYLAVDLGASGGRVLAGSLDGRRLRLEEIHRFDNGGIPAAGGLYWDLLGLWSQIVTGLRAAAARFPGRIKSVGVDTWGIDFAFLGRGDVLLENPHSYRDPRCEGMLERALARVPRAEIFAKTGAQFLHVNTLYQLLALSEQNSPLLEMAESFLMMPDLFHWLLTGVKANEYTDATTTQFYQSNAKAAGPRGCSGNWESRRTFWARSCSPAQTWDRSRVRLLTKPVSPACRWCCPARTIRRAR